MANKPNIDNLYHLFSFTVTGNAVIIDPNQVLVVEDVRIDTSKFTSARRTFPVPAGTINHLRFNLNGKPYESYPTTRMRFYLVDATNSAYNPAGLNPAIPLPFKREADDALLAVVWSTSLGAVTVTAVKNDGEEVGDGGDAAEIIFEPTQDIESSTVQDAIEEIGREHAVIGHSHSEYATLADIQSILSSVLPNFVVLGEVPTGNVDGINRVFTLTGPYRTGGLAVYLNGLRMSSGSNEDYVESGSGFSFNEAPWTGDRVIADYIKP